MRCYVYVLCRPFEEQAIQRARLARLSMCSSILHKNIGYNYAISEYFFIKLSNYVAYDNKNLMMPNSLGQGYICRSFVPCVNCFVILTKHLRVIQVLLCHFEIITEDLLFFLFNNAHENAYCQKQIILVGRVTKHFLFFVFYFVLRERKLLQIRTL